MDVEKIKTILKNFHIAEKWISEKKLIGINILENEKKLLDSNKINSTVLANSHLDFIINDNKKK